LSDKAVLTIAHLARIRIGPDEVAAVRGDLESILGLFDELASVDTTGIEPMAHPLDLEQRLRDDIVAEDVSRETFQALAPRVQDGLYVVPPVIE